MKIKSVYFKEPVQVQHPSALRREHILSKDRAELEIKGNWLYVMIEDSKTAIHITNISSVIVDEQNGSD